MFPTFQYPVQPDDRAFRRIDLGSFDPGGRLPEFTALDGDRKSISCQSRYVLEICRADGSTVIIGPPEPRDVYYTRQDNVFRLGSEFPVARLWVRDLNAPDARYKAPVVWQTKDNLQYCAFGGRTDNLELWGDAYFSAAYQLIRR